MATQGDAIHSLNSPGLQEAEGRLHVHSAHQRHSLSLFSLILSSLLTLGDWVCACGSLCVSMCVYVRLCVYVCTEERNTKPPKRDAILLPWQYELPERRHGKVGSASPLIFQEVCG